MTELVLRNGFTPFIDVAYQGLAVGLEEDAAGWRWMAARVPEMLIASSCSKNFGLYRERTGALTIIAQKESETLAAKSQVLNTARQIYSMPPSHGALAAGMIMSDATLRNSWEIELGVMRERITSMRETLVERLNENKKGYNFDFICNEFGMFSFLGITSDQVERLRSEFGIYMANSTRINIAGLNRGNVEYFSDSLCSVI